MQDENLKRLVKAKLIELLQAADELMLQTMGRPLTPKEHKRANWLAYETNRLNQLLNTL